MPSATGSREPLPPEEFQALLARQASSSQQLTDSAVRGIGTFLAELDSWRRRVNLTGRLSSEELVSLALESALGASLLPLSGTVVDVGTGGGFPGVPLAILRPDLAVTWLEPREKRAAFLRHVARMVPVANAVVEVARSEDLADSSFDFATSQAVRLEALMPLRFLKPGGGLLLWTTEAGAGGTSPAGLRRQEIQPIPGSRHRVLALYLKDELA